MAEFKTYLSGYSRDKTTFEARHATFEEVAALKPGTTVKVLGVREMVVNVRTSGAVKRWKTRPRDLRVPVKYGLYESTYVEWRDGEHYDGPRVLVEKTASDNDLTNVPTDELQASLNDMVFFVNRDEVRVQQLRDELARRK